MAGNIKGITIEFRGDTTKLDKALRQVRNDTKAIDKQLNDVNKALKFNPRNVELLAQKQALLKQKVDVTKKSLEDLKNTQEQMDAQGVDKSSEEYMALRREIIATESKVKTFEAQLRRANAEASKIGQVGKAWQDAGAKIEKAGRALRPVSMVSGAVFAGLSGITYKAGAAADDLNTLSKQTGISTHDLQMYAASADLVDVSVEAMAKSQQKLKKSMLGASEGGSQAKYFEQLGVAVQDSNGELRDSNDVFQDTIKALGEMENETERDAIAMAIFGKSANELNPLIEDGGATYEKVANIMAEHGLEPVSQEALDKANEFNDAIDTIKLMFNQAVQIVGTKVAGTLVPVMEKIVDVAGKIAEKIAGMDGGALTKIMGLTGALAGLSPVLVVIGKAMQLFGGHLKKVAEFAQKIPLVGKAFGLLTNPIFLVVAALSALGLMINQTGMSADDITAKISEISARIAEAIPGIIDTIVNVLITIVQTIASMAPQIVEGAVTLFTGLVDALPIILPVLINGIGQLIVAIVQALPGMAVSLIQAAVSIAQTLWQGVKQVFGTVVSWFGGVFGRAWKAVKEKFSGWAAFWSGLWQKVKDKFSDIGSSIGSAISNTVKSGINGVLSTIESVINGGISLLNGAIDLINKIPGVSIGHIGTLSLPRLAKGGVLNGAQTVIAGEAGPEAIIPLDKLFAQMDRMAETIKGPAGTNNIVINVYGTEGQSAREMAEEVKRVLINEVNRRRLAWQ